MITIRKANYSCHSDKRKDETPKHFHRKILSHLSKNKLKMLQQFLKKIIFKFIILNISLGGGGVSKNKNFNTSVKIMISFNVPNSKLIEFFLIFFLGLIKMLKSVLKNMFFYYIYMHDFLKVAE